MKHFCVLLAILFTLSSSVAAEPYGLYCDWDGVHEVMGDAPHKTTGRWRLLVPITYELTADRHCRDAHVGKRVVVYTDGHTIDIERTLWADGVIAWHLK